MTHLEGVRRLLSQEGAATGDAEERTRAAGRVYEKLFQRLAPVIGAAGMRALFARSVKLTRAQLPSLAEALMAEHPEQAPAAVLSGLSKLEPEAALTVTTSLYGNLLGLLITLIGERLVLKVLESTFPAAGEAITKETE